MSHADNLYLIYQQAIKDDIVIPNDMLARDLNNAIHLLAYIEKRGLDRKEGTIDCYLRSLFLTFYMLIDSLKKRYQ